MKNTIENKAKFFALYWGKNVLRVIRRRIIIKVVIGSDHRWNDWVKSGILELKPLSQVSDEDAIELFNLEGYLNLSYVTFDDDGFFLNWPFKGVKSKFKHLGELTSKQSDFLRGNGYALDWTTPEGETITVEEQIQYNWVKLTEK